MFRSKKSVISVVNVVTNRRRYRSSGHRAADSIKTLDKVKLGVIINHKAIGERYILKVLRRKTMKVFQKVRNQGRILSFKYKGNNISTHHHRIWTRDVKAKYSGEYPSTSASNLRTCNKSGIILGALIRIYYFSLDYYKLAAFAKNRSMLSRPPRLLLMERINDKFVASPFNLRYLSPP